MKERDHQKTRPSRFDASIIMAEDTIAGAASPGVEDLD